MGSTRYRVENRWVAMEEHVEGQKVSALPFGDWKAAAQSGGSNGPQKGGLINWIKN